MNHWVPLKMGIRKAPAHIRTDALKKLYDCLFND